MPIASGASESEPTLGALVHTIAHRRLPTQFYQLLQLAIPIAIQMASLGYYRLAGWLVVASVFGIWALCVKHVEDTESIGGRPSHWYQVGRSLAKGVGGALAAALVVDGLIQFLMLVFRCPGCAG